VLGYTDVDLWNSTTPEQRGPYNLDTPLARYEGMHVMHFNSADLSGLRARLISEGVECAEIKPFERPGADGAAPHAGARTAATLHETRARRAHFTVDIGSRAHISVVTPEQVGELIPGAVAPAVPSLVGFTVAVADLDCARRLLEKNLVRFQEFQGRLVVSAADACGSAVVFEA